MLVLPRPKTIEQPTQDSAKHYGFFTGALPSKTLMAGRTKNDVARIIMTLPITAIVLDLGNAAPITTTATA